MRIVLLPDADLWPVRLCACTQLRMRVYVWESAHMHIFVLCIAMSQNEALAVRDHSVGSDQTFDLSHRQVIALRYQLICHWQRCSTTERVRYQGITITSMLLILEQLSETMSEYCTVGYHPITKDWRNQGWAPRPAGRGGFPAPPAIIRAAGKWRGKIKVTFSNKDQTMHYRLRLIEKSC